MPAERPNRTTAAASGLRGRRTTREPAIRTTPLPPPLVVAPVYCHAPTGDGAQRTGSSSGQRRCRCLEAKRRCNVVKDRLHPPAHVIRLMPEAGKPVPPEPFKKFFHHSWCGGDRLHASMEAKSHSKQAPDGQSRDARQNDSRALVRRPPEKRNARGDAAANFSLVFGLLLHACPLGCAHAASFGVHLPLRSPSVARPRGAWRLASYGAASKNTTRCTAPVSMQWSFRGWLCAGGHRGRTPARGGLATPGTGNRHEDRQTVPYNASDSHLQSAELPL